MTLYYFDFHDDQNVRVDDVGVAFETPEQARREARRSLSDIVGDELFEEGERRSFHILVRNDKRDAIYTASMTYNGLWLQD